METHREDLHQNHPPEKVNANKSNGTVKGHSTRLGRGDTEEEEERNTRFKYTRRSRQLDTCETRYGGEMITHT